MTQFYIVRHGSTELNKLKKIQGHNDSALTKEGCEDAIKISKCLKNIGIQTIYSSDLGRAVKTAEIIAENIGFKDNIIKIKELRELNFGILTGMDHEEARKKFNGYRENPEIIIPQGESYLQLKERVMKKIYELEDKEIEKALIVTHAGCLRCIMSEGQKIDIRDILNIEKAGEMGHDKIIKIDVKDSKINSYEIIKT